MILENSFRMTHFLCKEQLLILQHNLTYEVYEQFISMFPTDELLPEDITLRNKYILKTMKEHPYWGEIKGWGDKRVYKNIPKIYLILISPFKGTTKNELLKFLDTFSYNGLQSSEFLISVSEDDDDDDDDDDEI